MSLVDQPREPVSSIPDMCAHQKQDLDNPSYRSTRSASGSSVTPSHLSDNDDSDFTDSLTESEYESADDDLSHDDDMKPADKHVAVARAIPALPVKSSLRASRLLDDLTPLKIGAEEQPVLSQAPAPHAVYLSSEEDASSSADDFSDFESESDGEVSPLSPRARSSHEITAHAITVIFSGKPSLVDVSPRSSSPESAASPTTSRPRASRTNTDSSLPHRPSVSSARPSRYSTCVSPSEMEKARPGFLNMDPFPSPPEEDSSLPKSPSGARFKRTFSLSRKHSKTSLDQTSIYSREYSSTQTLPVEQPEETRDQGPSSVKQAAPRAPANYKAMLKAARVQSPPIDAAPETPNKSKSRFGFMNRRRGIRS